MGGLTKLAANVAKIGHLYPAIYFVFFERIFLHPIYDLEKRGTSLEGGCSAVILMHTIKFGIIALATRITTSFKNRGNGCSY